MFTTIATSHGLEANQVVSLRVLPELRKLAVVMRSGDITTVSLDADGTVGFDCRSYNGGFLDPLETSDRS